MSLQPSAFSLQPSASLSVAIIAKDEARYIGGCIASAQTVADEVLVLLDDRSADDTAAICRACGAYVAVEPWRGFGGQRNRALDLCSHSWVLFLDADERITAELAEEIRALRASAFNLQPSAFAAYGMPRYNLFFGRRLRGGGWYPDVQLRLLRRERARYDARRLVHEFPLLNGEAGLLQGHLLHYNIDSLGEFWRKQTDFARKEADTLFHSGVRARRRTFVGAPARQLWRRFVRLGGWRDGALGLFLCGALAFFEVIKTLRRWGWDSVLRKDDARP